MAKITLEQLIDIAFAVEEGDPFGLGIIQTGKIRSNEDDWYKYS